MDMGKYVAVGVLAVIVLAAVTYEGPKDAGGPPDPQRITGEVGPRAEAPSPEPPPAGDAPVAEAPPTADVAPAATATTTAQAPSIEAAAAAVQAAAPEVLRYTVKAGQTLSDVAQEWLGDRGRWREVYRHNQDQLPSPDLVRAGLTLQFPAQEVARAPQAQPAATTVAASTPRIETPARPGERTYTVARGDTLYAIARRELGQGGRWREIVALNDLKTETVAAGTRLRLPAR